MAYLAQGTCRTPALDSGLECAREGAGTCGEPSAGPREPAPLDWWGASVQHVPNGNEKRGGKKRKKKNKKERGENSSTAFSRALNKRETDKSRTF